MKREIGFLCIFVLLAGVLSVTAYANGPAPPNHITCEIINKPDDAVFVDLLIEISQEDRQYTSYNAANGQAFQIGADSRIVAYNEGGLQSFTFHFEQSASNFVIDASSPSVKFAHQNDQYQILLEEYHILKIALLDENGNIIQISDSVDINPNSVGFFMGEITYDAASNLVDAPYYNSPFAVLFAIFSGVLVLLRMCVSSSIETLIAIPFQIKPLRYIFAVNMATQVLLVIFMSLCTLPYGWALVIIEAVVYLAEFNLFGFIYKEIPVRRLAAFVTAANTSSLLLGLLWNFMG